MDTPNTIAQQGEDIPLDSLIPHPENPRRGDVDAIEESILANGWYGAIIVQRSTRYILAGNHRWQGAKRAGALTIPVIFVEVDDATARRIVLADNRTADLATYEQGTLGDILRSIQAEAGNLAGTGYTNADLDQIFELLKSVQAEAAGDSAPRQGKVKPTVIVFGPDRIKVDQGELAEYFNTLRQSLGANDESTLITEIKRRLQLP